MVEKIMVEKFMVESSWLNCLPLKRPFRHEIKKCGVENSSVEANMSFKSPSLKCPASPIELKKWLNIINYS